MDRNEGLPDSTESSLYTESTESRSHYHAQPRQGARILLEKRRQELPKVTAVEQAYMRHSTRKQVPYHPLKQPPANGIIQTIKAAHTNRIKQLENQVAEDQIKINEYATELRTMKTQQKRLEMEIKKYQGMAGNIPHFMRGQEEELRTVQHELKKAKMQSMRLGQNLALREDELRRVKQENQRWRRLEDVMQLEDREKLYEENEDLKHQIAQQNDKILMLTRKGMLEVKNLKSELLNERRKHRATQESLSDALEAAEKLRSDLELKQKYIMYNSLRFTGQQKKTPPDALESVSLISLTGNSYGSVKNQLKLDPELVRHYPKTPDSVRPADHLTSAAASSPVTSSLNILRDTPLTLENDGKETSKHSSKKNTSNSTLKKSPSLPLPSVATQNTEDDSLSEASNLSEEDIELYSSSFGSHSRKETHLTDSQKSSLEFRKDSANGNDSDSKESGISEKTRQNGVSLPNLATTDGNGEGNGGQLGGARERVSRGDNRIYIGEKSLMQQKSHSQSLAKESRDKQNRNSPDPEEQKLLLRSPPLTRAQILAKEFSEMEEKERSEKTRSDAIKAEYKEYFKFKTESKQGIDQVSKGKLLAALNAIEKGGDPIAILPFNSGQKPATIFTASRNKSPAAPIQFDQVTEDLHHGRPTKRNKSPDDTVQITSLDRFKSDSPPEHPTTRSELIRELFGGGSDVDYGDKFDVAAPKKSMSFERVGFNDRNNNEDSSEANAFYPTQRVTLTNWKH